MVVYAYNLSEVGSEGRRMEVLGQPGQKSPGPYLKNNWKQKGQVDMAQVVECLPSKSKAQ
jgi:hypothetical protein